MRIAQIPPQKTVRNVGPRYCSVGENILSRYSDNKVIVITRDPMLTSRAPFCLCVGGGGGRTGEYQQQKPNQTICIISVI